MADAPRKDAEKIAVLLARGLPVASVLLAIAAGVLYDLGTAILVLAFGVLLGIIAILWASVRTLAGDAPITVEEALAISAPTAVEEQKRAVLSALKDLEYERSVGKITEADYQDLSQRYRTEAKRLLRSLDDEMKPMRDRAEAYVMKELGGEPRRKQADSDDTEEARPVSSQARSPSCPSCQTPNDADALFCKKCGTKFGDAREKQDATA
jgi:hypothetical protein